MANDQVAASLPTALTVHVKSKVLEVGYDNGNEYRIPFELMRVYSPSAEVMGHGPGQETLVLGKQSVGIREVEPVGQYAVRLVFDDGHDTGLYTWKYLREMGREQPVLWRRYLEKVAAVSA